MKTLKKKKRKSLETFIKIFKKIINRNKPIKELKEKLYYKKPSILKKEKKIKKIKKIQRKLRKINLNKNLY